jgi:hypothetical protein
MDEQTLRLTQTAEGPERYRVEVALEGDELYAHAALRNYATYGDRAADKMQKTKGLIERIERDMRGGGA